jgi:hypothetical protein
MKESLRRIILFTVIVATGSVMILFDVPLILMIPLILAVGFVILLLLGAITIADIRSVLKNANIRNLKKIKILKRLDEMKFFEKKGPQQDKKPAPAAVKMVAAPGDPKKTGTGSHLHSFFTSLRSLGTVLKERSKQGRKVEHINELLDKAVSEKVKGSALATAAGNGAKIKPSSSVGASIPVPNEQTKEQDPFLSLSGDEFDISLLDGLDDQESSPKTASADQVPMPLPSADGPAIAMPEPEIPLPSLDISSEADDILKNNEGEGLEEFKGLEGGESIDKDFGELDNLSIDDIDLDIDMEEETTAASGSSSAKTTETASPSSSPNPVKTIQTDWVDSDAPKNAATADNEISKQAEMASFAGGASGTDDDLLSSLASDVKHVAKEENISLLRDLKDFRAPAATIENELKEMYETLKSASDPRKKVIPPGKGVK